MKAKFERLIKKNSSTYTFTTIDEGHFEGPNWVEGNPIQVDVDCAIFPFSTKDVVRYDGLGYTTKDIKIFIPESEDIGFKKEDSVVYKGITYELDRPDDRTTHSDFIKWFAKRVENQ